MLQVTMPGIVGHGEKTLRTNARNTWKGSSQYNQIFREKQTRQHWRNTQKKIEDIENKIKSIEEGKQVGRSWVDIVETQDKLYILVFGCPESESDVAEEGERHYANTRPTQKYLSGKHQ